MQLEERLKLRAEYRTQLGELNRKLETLRSEMMALWLKELENEKEIRRLEAQQ